MVFVSVKSFGSSISAHSWPYLISSRVLFVGCLASLGLYSHCSWVVHMQSTFLLVRFVNEKTICLSRMSNFLGLRGSCMAFCFSKKLRLRRTLKLLRRGKAYVFED